MYRSSCALPLCLHHCPSPMLHYFSNEVDFSAHSPLLSSVFLSRVVLAIPVYLALGLSWGKLILNSYHFCLPSRRNLLYTCEKSSVKSIWGKGSVRVFWGPSLALWPCPTSLHFALLLIASHHKMRLQPPLDNSCICLMVEEAVAHFYDVQHHHTLFKMRLM